MIEPGHLLDGNMKVHPLLDNFGSEILDKFSDEENNLKFVPQFSESETLFSWMLGVPNRIILAGEEFRFACRPLEEQIPLLYTPQRATKCLPKVLQL